MHICRFLLTVGSISFALAVSPRLSADATADARKAIEANYSKSDVATVNKDFDTQCSFMMPGGEHIDEAGNISKFQSAEEKKKGLSQFSTAMNKLHLKVCKTIIKTFILKGSEATATVSRHSEIVFRYADGKDHTVRQDQRLEEVWMKKDSRWLMKRQRESTLKATLDGKPFKP